MWWRALKYILVESIFLAVGTVFLADASHFKARSEPTSLIVLHVDSQRNADHRWQYRPTFGLNISGPQRTEYTGNRWTGSRLHEAGDIVPGRYDPVSGEMRSDKMQGWSQWFFRVAQLLGAVVILQGVLILFGVPEFLLPLRVRMR